MEIRYAEPGYKSLVKRLKDAGVPDNNIHQFGLDLYVNASPVATKVIDEWAEEYRVLGAVGQDYHSRTTQAIQARENDYVMHHMVCIGGYYRTVEREGSDT